MSTVVVVSPHRDDAAFSCSVAIRELSRTCQITVANCFTVSQYAPFNEKTGDSVTAVRLEEDRRFAAYTGVTLHDLSLVDAPERLGIEFSQISTMRPFGPQDDGPRTEIRNHVRAQTADLILLPLTIGNHIDHRIAQAAILDTGQDALAFYEDLPYSARCSPEMIESRVRESPFALTPYLFHTPDAYHWKLSCASLYPSQINSSTCEEIAAYGDRYGQGERLWITAAALQILASLA